MSRKYTLMLNIRYLLPRAKEGESLLASVDRSAKDCGLRLAQVGFALIEFPDGHVEEYQTVPDPWNLLSFLNKNKLFPDELLFRSSVNDVKRMVEIYRQYENKAIAQRENA